MAPTPVPTPSPSPSVDVLGAVGSTWDSLQNGLDWFVEVARSIYGWSDLIIATRQKQVDRKYVEKKAEERAYQLMEAQRQRNLAAIREKELMEEKMSERPSVQKRDLVFDWDGDTELYVDLIDDMLYEEILRDL